MPDDQLISGMLAMTPAEIKVQMYPYLRALLKTAHLLRQRDEMTLQKLMSTKGSGIYFVGKAHLNSQLDLLRTACLGQLTTAMPAQGGNANR